MGSSPRLRGAPPPSAACHQHQGIIPALAGSTQIRWQVRLVCRDHPRACGEHLNISISSGLSKGSSPRLRGAPYPRPRRAWREGIIPALAGSTEASTTIEGSVRDHPRACGEYTRRMRVAGSREGSSPRLRGARWTDWRRVMRRGIIPALAGSTTVTTVKQSVTGDHPRACGEHLCNLRIQDAEWGSSPRLRGALALFLTFLFPLRIIPALAGSTRSPCESDRC